MLETPVYCETLTSLGPFELLEKIGRGGHATVYKARHKPTGKIAAVKVMPRCQELHTGLLERFQREFTAIRELRHPHIVRALAFGKDKEVLYLVLELVPGQNLEVRLKQHGCLTLEETAPIFSQIADGLRYLHSKHILHRDVKPSNIFLTADNTAKLGDFGLLKKLTDDAQITWTRQALGTMEYGAPEQFEDAKWVDKSCDLFSLAATMYTALTGKFPFGKGGQRHILQRKLLCQFVPLRLVLPALDPAVDQLVSRCLDPDPRRRPSDCAEFLGILQSFRAGTSPATARDSDCAVPSFEPSSETDRRATLRFAVDLTATFVPFHQNLRGRWEATILDISTLGVRLQTLRPVPVNSVLHVTLGQRATSELALVRWVKPGEGPMQIVGCAFVRPLPRQELEAICTSAVDQPG